jgi:Uma2 family endonuclease
MSTIPRTTEQMSVPTGFCTLADLHDQLGGIPLERIRVVSAVGTATEKDLLRVLDHENRICELIDGVLVEKAMGYFESRLAATLVMILGRFVDEHDLGIVLAADGALRILSDQIRAPDVAFLNWDRFPGRQRPAEPIPAIVPDLAVQVLSAGNTEREMERKLDDYFAAGVRLVWIIDPATKSATSYESRQEPQPVKYDESLSGRNVVPGFELPLRELFEKAWPRAGR